VVYNRPYAARPEPCAKIENALMKFGRVKRQHGRLLGLDEICHSVLRGCPEVSRIVPGRIKVRKGNSRGLKVQYPTEAGLKCLYCAPGTVQEVFLICTDQVAAQTWLEQSGLL
jgi:hypothetical protein